MIAVIVILGILLFIGFSLRVALGLGTPAKDTPEPEITTANETRKG